jgi:hypothetical protein
MHSVITDDEDLLGFAYFGKTMMNFGEMMIIEDE